ncbi:MAG TPA: endonuclease MutS2 [Candidatus Scatavimonas merdigallinarum]|uniref:Endonuclease MutS2 n=1 Tax=Candidatus Scatavimonas merdigallinarum TaxID=2840914 RepID=A0A9D0ZIQ2_9FIRM|nr:endonuclease MutS2 [Candidatus Scatavimonas merdigallinarum]
MNKHEKALELDKILDRLSQETTCPDARDLALRLEPVHNAAQARRLLEETADAHMLAGRFGAPSFYGMENVTNALKRGQAGGILTMKELLLIAQCLRVIRSVAQWRQKSQAIKTALDLRFEGLIPNKYMEDKITGAILSEDEMADQASHTLAEIRKKIAATSAKAREALEKMVRSAAYQKYLQEAIITMRDGRFVVPVKAECKGNISGLVHDTSASGATLFIEPMSVVEANNEIKVLKAKEEQEIERILFALSAEVGSFADAIIGSYENLVELNVIFAKAQLGYKMKASVPVLNEEGIIRLHSARHPLIASDRVVPTDIELGDRFDTLVITGPNTGGKTVSLKTLGLLTLMAMCGLMIPVRDNSQISVFQNVLVDIGDEQSIEQSLSTFSAHMTNITQILKQADANSLVLIDELGAGTDPVEGAALAIAILERLHAIGAKTASTTHYAELKAYALQTKRVENGCCEFDVATLRPTYKLLIGVAGKSNAFAISERLGLEQAVVERARTLVSRENRAFEDVMQTLESKRQELEKHLKQAQQAVLQAQADRQAAKKELDGVKQQTEKEIKRAKEEAQRISTQTKAQAYAILDHLEEVQKKKESLSAEDRTRLKAKIKSMEDSADPIKEKENDGYKLPRKLKPGDSVLIFDIDKEGVVLKEEDAAGQVLVQAGIIKTKVPVANLRLLDQKPKQQVVRSVSRNVRGRSDIRPVTEVDLRGMTAIEAVMELDSAIDAAVLSGLGRLTVIHGKGTGVLRREVHTFLKGHKAVCSFRLGVYGEGETGVTIVELK